VKSLGRHIQSDPFHRPVPFEWAGLWKCVKVGVVEWLILITETADSVPVSVDSSLPLPRVPDRASGSNCTV